MTIKRNGNQRLAALFIIALLTLTMICSCKKSPDVKPISSHNGETTSHNVGLVCMNCHTSGGEAGEYQWVVCGSVYKADGITPNPNGIINFWTGPLGTGNLVASLEVDGKGNFFTNSAILPASGCYPQIKGASGNIKNMVVLNASGNCNYCHNSSTNRIWVE